MRKWSTLLLALGLSAVLFTAAACSGRGSMDYYDELNVKYYDSEDAGKTEHNRNLFYLNELTTMTADPSAIYVTEGEEAGYFYLYGTTNEVGDTGVYSWRSKDLSSWQLMGPAFVPDRQSWALNSIWAPEVIAHGGKYWMYYSGYDRQANRMSMSVAVGDAPQGPFHEYEGADANGDALSAKEAVFKELPWPAIDASPFIDTSGEDERIYVYFARDQYKGEGDSDKTSTVWGMEMKDMVTPDYGTLVQLTDYRLDTPGGAENQTWETQRWNEAPFMYKRDGRYYLTYSYNFFESRDYSVGVAYGESPLGPFVKPTENNRILSVDDDYDFMSGTGHHSFVEAGDELFVVYHAHTDRYFGGKQRAIAVDRVLFREDGSMHVNGPTYSLQPLPAIASGYRNLAAEATVTATGVLSGSDVAALTDGMFAMHSWQQDVETRFDKKTTITITFDRSVSVRAILLYNSYAYDDVVTKVNKIDFGNKNTIENLMMDVSRHAIVDEDMGSIMRPGGAAVAEFNEIKTNSITITVNAGKEFAIGDIVILGK